jgi:hypothetical protein
MTVPSSRPVGGRWSPGTTPSSSKVDTHASKVARGPRAHTRRRSQPTSPLVVAVHSLVSLASFLAVAQRSHVTALAARRPDASRRGRPQRQATEAGHRGRPQRQATEAGHRGRPQRQARVTSGAAPTVRAWARRGNRLWLTPADFQVCRHLGAMSAIATHLGGGTPIARCAWAKCSRPTMLAAQNSSSRLKVHSAR